MLATRREQRRQQKLAAQRCADASAKIPFVRARLSELEQVAGGADPGVLWAIVGLASMVPLFDNKKKLRPIEGAAVVAMWGVQLRTTDMRSGDRRRRFSLRPCRSSRPIGEDRCTRRRIVRGACPRYGIVGAESGWVVDAAPDPGLRGT